MGLPEGPKLFKDRFRHNTVCDRRTDTGRQQILRLRIASRGKNCCCSTLESAMIFHLFSTEMLISRVFFQSFP